MPGVIGKRNAKHARNRRNNPEANSPQPVNPVLITGMTIIDTIVTLTFDQVVMLTGTPQFRVKNYQNIPAISARQLSPDTVEITYAGSVSGVASMNIGFRDPAIRSATGGYVTSNVYSIAA